MKIILFLTGFISLLATTGCLVAEGRRHGHRRHEDHSVILVPAPVLVVPVVHVHGE